MCTFVVVVLPRASEHVLCRYQLMPANDANSNTGGVPLLLLRLTTERELECDVIPNTKFQLVC